MIDVLVVEDNRELGELLCDFLKAEGYQTALAPTGEEGLALARREGARLVVLDVMLPGMDGLAVCRALRQEGDLPILVVSARSEKEDKLAGLRLGADDYIEKPYDVDILLAKIRGIFQRRYERTALRDGDLALDRQRRAATLAGRPLALTAKEFDLLWLLVEHRGKSLRKEWIFDRIWGTDSFSEPQTLTVHIQWLRQKIERDPRHPARILTVWGVGYRFEGEADEAL